MAWPGRGGRKAGTYRYDLPSVVPAGVVLDLTASHDEKGSRHCTAHVGVLIPGGPFDSPLIWAALAGLVIFGAALFLLGRPPGAAGMGRLIAGTLVGFLFGLFLGLTTVLFGLIPLASPVVTVLILLGAVAGVVWVRSGVAAKPA